MIPIRKIDTFVAFLGLLLFVGAFKATMTSFDPTVGGAVSIGNIRLQLTSGLVYISIMFLILLRVEKFLNFCQNNLIIIGFLLIPLFSVFWSIAPDVTARRGGALLGTSLFAMYLAFALPVERVIRILAVVYALTTIGSVFIIAAFPVYGTHQFGDYVGLWRGLYAQKNEFGATMAMAAIVIFLCPKYTSRERLLSRIFVVLCLFLMFMSESRAAWISFGCVCAIALAVWRASGRGSKTSVKIFLLILISISFGAILLKNAIPLLEMVGKDPTLSGRTDVWALALDRAEDRPFLGFGYRAYWIDENKLRLMAEESWADNINHGHNTYLDLFLELGYLGIIVFILTLGALIFKILSRIKYSNDYINIWAISSVCFILIRGAAESTILQHADINWVLFVYFFSLFASYRKPVRDQSQSELRVASDGLISNNVSISSIFFELKRDSTRNQTLSSMRTTINARVEERSR
ncbi:MAG: O-antigen ligase family protein [Geminicoccaceae bacterium]